MIPTIEPAHGFNEGGVDVTPVQDCCPSSGDNAKPPRKYPKTRNTIVLALNPRSPSVFFA